MGDDWEDYDPSSGLSLTSHMVAGSLAGLMEHVAIFPIDTVKTHLHRALKSVRNQVRAAQSAALPAPSSDAVAPQRRRKARTSQPAAASASPEITASHPAGETL